MILYSDPKEVEAHALGAIKKYGFAPEHSYTCFSNSAEEGMKPVYIATEEGYGAFGYAPDSKDEDEWELSGEPLAPQEARAGIIAEWVKHAFKHGAAKMHLELSDETRQLRIDNWCLMSAAADNDAAGFDLDTYKILHHFLANPAHQHQISLC
jgi:hypothetical protein